ncbi:MAG TPA: ThiF family adenylyltransferase [Candidatus Saccharimonadales bacterium]|nr:ThiF family adenylyltransferase [Candidatus Saccharimonadales bacterium]
MSYDKRFGRNLGFFSTEEQATLRESSVSIAGAGGDGGMLAVQLARLGVGEIRLADPDPFEEENINRQAACTDETIGVNKAQAVGDYIQRINPEAKVKIFDDGVTPENTADFLDGSRLLIDETEFTMPSIGVGLARQARYNGIPNLTALNVGFGAVVTTYRPEGPTVESRLGVEGLPLEEISADKIPISRWLPYLPSYGDLRVLDSVAKAEKPAPSVAPGVALAAGMAATQAALNLLHGQNKRPKPVYAPSALVMDVMTGTAKIVSYDRLSHYRHLATVVFRNTLKLNPRASY